MDLEIYIHGASKGHQVWPIEKKDAYINCFYVPASEETKFLIELRSNQDGKLFCYYSYLKYKNVVGGDGRDGSYFGITLRLDYYCTDVVTIYNILDTIYKKHIIGTLLSRENGINKYIVTDFQTKENELNEAKKTLISLLQLSVSSYDFLSIQSLQAYKDGSLPEVNLLDCTKDNILSVMRKCSKVAISPYYLTLKDKHTQNTMNDQIDNIRRSKESEISNLNDQLNRQKKLANDEKNVLTGKAENLQKKIDDLTSDKAKLSASLSSLEKENQSLQNKLRSSEERKNAAELVASLREPLTKLAKIVGTSDEEHRHTHYRYEHMEHEHSRKHTANKMKDFFFPILHTVLLLLIVVYCSFRTYNEMVDKKHESVDTEIQNTPTVNEELETIVPNTITQEAAVAENPSGQKKAKF